MEDRPPTEDELERMKALVRDGMAAGAFGLSSGLYYAPGSYAATEEVVALAREVHPVGVYTSHIRDESDYTVGLIAAVEEVVRISEEADIPGIVTHFKALGPDSWGLSRRGHGAHREGARAGSAGVGGSVSLRGLGDQHHRGSRPAMGSRRGDDGRAAFASRERA